MRLTHDTEGIFYLEIRKLEISHTKQITFFGRYILLDLSSDGKIVGIEYIHFPIFMI